MLNRSIFMCIIFAAFALSSSSAAASSNRFVCKDDICTCTGDADCNDMFTSVNCGDLSYCTLVNGQVYCQCLKRQTQLAQATGRRTGYAVTAIDPRSGTATVQDAHGRRATIPVSAPLLRRIKAGDKLYVRESSTSFANLQKALSAAGSKKTPQDCETCRNDCFKAVSAKYHVVMKDGLATGDAGWDAAMRNCLSANGCTSKDCAE